MPRHTSPLPPTRRELSDARERFAALVLASAQEAAFQRLFAECPFVLSQSLPLRLAPMDIQPLGRPGKSEPDFIFYRRSGRTLSSFGVIELKRPSTSLVTIPRKNLVLLSRDAETAVKQAQQYSRQMQADLRTSLNENLIIGTAAFAFVIAGMSDEITRKLSAATLYQSLEGLLPSGAQIIPYDELLRRFEDGLEPRVVCLVPERVSDVNALARIVAEAEARSRAHVAINDDSMDFWTTIEDRWRAGGFVGTLCQRVIDREYWCIAGTDTLATESPAHIDFPAYVQELLRRIQSSLIFQRQLAEMQRSSQSVAALRSVLTERQLTIVDDLIRNCREERYHNSFTNLASPDDSNISVLARLGLIRFTGIESTDAWYDVDPVLLRLWPTETRRSVT